MNNSAPGFDTTVFDIVLTEGTPSQRMAMAKQLAAFYCDPDSAELEIAQIRRILLKITHDDSKDIRAAFAEALMQATRIEPELAFSIAADDDDIALPFIATTRIASPQHLFAVFRVGDEMRQKVVAARPDIAAETINYAVHEATPSVALIILGNENAVLSEAQVRTLYRRFSQSEAVVHALLKRADLPLDIRITETRRGSVRLRQSMAEKGFMPGTDVAELCSDAEDIAVFDLLVQAPVERRMKAIAFMASKNLLLPSFILRAASTGQMVVVEAAMAHLTDMRPDDIVRQMYHPNPTYFKSLFRRSGLPQACFGVLRAACDVVIDMREVGLTLSATEFGARVLEALMTRYEDMAANDRVRQVEFLGRYGEEKVRRIAKRIKVDLQRAA